jgi:D-3-phosphoglycerate dehydrogenase
MKKVLIATDKPFAPIAVKKIASIIEKGGYSFVLLEKYSSKTDLIRAVSDADALIVRSDIVDREVISTASKLKIVVRAGAGYDNIDCRAATENGVVVMNTPGQNSNAVAELAVGLALMGIRDFYSGKTGGELRGRTLGLHGFGYVAHNVFRIARAFGMKVIVYTQRSKASAAAIGLKVTDSLEELYKKSDIISIHVPALNEHIGSVSYEVLKNLEDGSVIVNTARKEVINEEDLIRIMKEKPGIKYLADIMPSRIDEFNTELKGRFYFTPKKLGAQTEEANINSGIAAAEQIVSFFKTGDCTFQVNK